jgi:hypothetical protein
VKDPSAWMDKGSIPFAFDWKDPSKIQVGEIFRLLDHWRDREAQGLIPLVWVPTSPLFQDAEVSQKKVRKVRQARTLQAQKPNSDEEETFELPSSSSDDDQGDYKPEADEPREKSSPEPDDSDDEKSDDPQPKEGHPCEWFHLYPCIYFICSRCNCRYKRALRSITG